jgi:hypothetical protein
MVRLHWLAGMVGVGLLAGCAMDTNTGKTIAPTAGELTISGQVHGGQQPVANAAIQLYTVGTLGDGSAATPLLTQPVTTNASGSFTITGLYSCTGATEVYLTATGGNPGGASTNADLSMMTAIGLCSSLTPSTFISVNEITTIAAVYALAPYMTSVAAIGSGSSDQGALASAFGVAGELVSSSAGSSPGIGVPSGYTVPSTLINTLGDIVAGCINSNGGAAGDPSLCGQLFSLTKSTAGVAPLNTTMSLLNLANNPTMNTVAIFNLGAPSGPFQAQLATPPPDFRIRLIEPASQMALQIGPSSVAFPQTAEGFGSAPQSITIQNISSASVTLGTIAIRGANAADFNQAGNCGATLQALASCTVQVEMTPTASGSRSAYLSVSSSTIDSPQYVALGGTASASGTGPLLSLGASSLTFTAAAELSSTAQTVSVTNTGTATLNVTGISFGGANGVNFSETDTCSGSIAPQNNCTISVVFTPFLALAQTATMTVASNAGLPQTVSLNGTGTGTLAINTSNSTKWVITNGAMTYNFDPATGHITNVYWQNNTGINLVDTTITSNGYPDGLYMDNTGTNLASGTNSAGYTFGPNNSYLDVYMASTSSSTNAFTQGYHFIFTPNDTGFHIYSNLAHGAGDIAGNIGQWQYVFRVDQSKFVETYSVNAGLNNLGVMDVPLPSVADMDTSDPGRQVQNACVDLHGFTLPTGFTREFFTKYDYSSTEYLHQEHGIYGASYGAWMVLPSKESLVGGPTKQDLIFTGNIVMLEALSGHLDNELVYAPAQGVASNRLFGPYYYHFNAFTTTNTTPASLFQEAQTFLPSFNQLYDSDATLASAGYVASTARGTVSATIANGGSATANTAWTVLSDPATNIQYTTQGNQYWTNNTTGAATLPAVVPGTYRLSSYVLGQWGELRKDGIVVNANQTTVVPAQTFTPENFGTATPIWTIGAPDRSAHEFLHGEDANGNDLRNFYGAYNYWADFASTSGQQVYYATAVGQNPATNNLSKINYVQWGEFDPGLYAGIYNATDDTTDGYKYIVPSYVTSLTESVPSTTIHFTTTTAQLAQGKYGVLSVALADADASLTVSLNGHNLVWHFINASDAMARSGLSGYYQWIAYQWDIADLNAAGADNVLTFSPSQPDGVMFDALRFEMTNTSADPAVTGWHDYEYLYNSTYTPANDAVSSN